MEAESYCAERAAPWRSNCECLGEQMAEWEPLNRGIRLLEDFGRSDRSRHTMFRRPKTEYVGRVETGMCREARLLPNREGTQAVAIGIQKATDIVNEMILLIKQTFQFDMAHVQQVVCHLLILHTARTADE